jgi:hypothetical protein
VAHIWTQSVSLTEIDHVLLDISQRREKAGSVSVVLLQLMQQLLSCL